MVATAPVTDLGPRGRSQALGPWSPGAQEPKSPGELADGLRPPGTRLAALRSRGVGRVDGLRERRGPQMGRGADGMGADGMGRRWRGAQMKAGSLPAFLINRVNRTGAARAPFGRADYRRYTKGKYRR